MRIGILVDNEFVKVYKCYTIWNLNLGICFKALYKYYINNKYEIK